MSRTVFAAVTAASVLVATSSAVAQETATATSTDEVTPLPPVVVVAPKERLERAKAAKAGPAPKSKGTTQQPAAADEVAEGGGASAGGPPASSGLTGVFALGELDMVGGTVVSSGAMRTFSKDTLDAALALAPGVNASNSGGSRNEQLIFVRGFDRWQVPLSIDGIRVYRPADNRFDFSNFLTPDMSEVQIAKGYTSVLNGPGGMGGAINLVTKKPQKAVEGEVQGGMTFGPNGEYEGYRTYGSVGTRQKGFYAQASGIIVERDGWHLSDDFTPTAVENGGMRENSWKDSYQVNLKLGITPNSTDDYSINYIKSNSARGAPYHITDPIGPQRYWTWPESSVESIYWLSHTKVGEASFVDTKFYYSSYADKLRSYDDPDQTTQALPKAFVSYYDDYAYGGSLTAGTDLTPWNTLKGSFHFRRDSHKESQLYNRRGFPCANAPCYSEPTQQNLEDTYSVALEHTLHVTRQLDFVAGVSYDWRNMHAAEEFTAQDPPPGGTFFSYELKDTDAFNWQSALIWRATPGTTWHASVSDRTRFPTVFERFSSRFGGATSNPDLKAERGTNYEIGVSSALGSNGRVSGAIFYSDVTDVIQSVPIIFNGERVDQSQNVGSGDYYGIEGSIDYAFSSSLAVGGNVTLMQRDINNPNIPNFELTGVPRVKGIAYLTYHMTDDLSITPSIEFASDRWTSKPGNIFYETGAFALVNLQGEYSFTPETSMLLTARNLFDEDYTLTDGYPEAGRSFQATFRAKF